MAIADLLLYTQALPRRRSSPSPVRVNGLGGLVTKPHVAFLQYAMSASLVHETGGYERRTDSGGLHRPDPVPCVDGAAAAIDFYVSVFGAKLVDRMDGPDGIVAHAELNSATAACSCPTRRKPAGWRPGPSEFASHSVACTARVDASSPGPGGGRHDPRARADLRHRRPVRVDRRPVRSALDGDDARKGCRPRSRPPARRVGQEDISGARARTVLCLMTTRELGRTGIQVWRTVWDACDSQVRASFRGLRRSPRPRSTRSSRPRSTAASPGLTPPRCTGRAGFGGAA